MAIATRQGRGFPWKSPWLIGIVAIAVVVVGTVGIGFGTGLFRFGSQSGPPVATSPTAGPTASPAPIPSPSAAPTTRSLIAVLGEFGGQVAFKRELRLVALDGTVVASTLVDDRVSDAIAAAGGDHAAYVDSSNHLREFRADGQTRDLGILETPSYSGIQTTVQSFDTSPDGTLWAWTAVAFDEKHPWPGSYGSPTTYSDIYLSDGAGPPKHVYHEVGDSFPLLFRWTAKGPLFFWHPFANPPVPAFHLKILPLMLLDVGSGTVQAMTGDVVDIAADGTIAYATRQQGLRSISFVQSHATTTIDIAGFDDSDVQIQPGAVATAAVVGLATTTVDGGLQRSYQTRLVDIASGKMRSEPILNARPAWRAWLPDGQVLLQRWSDNAALVYSATGSLRTVPGVFVEIIGTLSAN